VLIKYDPRNLSRVFYRDKDGHYWPIPYRNLGAPPISLREQREAIKWLPRRRASPSRWAIDFWDGSDPAEVSGFRSKIHTQEAKQGTSSALNKHCFKSLFSCLFCVKRNLVSQNRRLGQSELRVRQVTFSVEWPLSGVAGFHTLVFVHHLALAVRLSIYEAELLAKRLKSAKRHDHDVHWHVDVAKRIP
jgi:hypothetical protein